MSAEPVKFYQVGSFAVGNRLLDITERSAQSDPSRPNSINSGHRACQGCGEALGARYALDAAMRRSDRRAASHVTTYLTQSDYTADQIARF